MDVGQTSAAMEGECFDDTDAVEEVDGVVDPSLRWRVRDVTYSC